MKTRWMQICIRGKPGTKKEYKENSLYSLRNENMFEKSIF